MVGTPGFRGIVGSMRALVEWVVGALLLAFIVAVIALYV
jgi:hypothetical protein